MTAIARIIAVAGPLLLVGCYTGPRLRGTYEGTRPFDTPQGGDPIIAKQMATVKLTVNADGTAELSDAGIPVTGRIDYDENGANFVPLKIAGVAVERQKPDVVGNYRARLTHVEDGQWKYKGNLILRQTS